MASPETTPSCKLAENGVVSPSNNEAHAKLITELQGQVMHVPNMLELFPSWPSGGRNKYYKRLKARFEELLESLFPDETMRRRAAKQDFAFFTSIWFPDADWDQLYTCGLFSWWLFHTDDTMDENEESLALDFAASCRYRQQVLDYTRWCLGLDPIYPRTSIISRLLGWFLPAPKTEDGWAYTPLSYLGLRSRPEPPCPNLPCSVFKEFGERLQRNTSKVFREMFYTEVKDYIDHCEIEQKQRLTGKMPDSLESFLQIRFSTSCVRAYGYITQLGVGVRLPIWIVESPEMQSLWDELSVNIIIANDVLSVKKELAGGCVHNAIPVMYYQGQNLDAIMSELMARLEASRDRFDEIALRLQEMASGASDKEREDLLKFIDGLRTNTTGTMEFCKLAGRYGHEKYFNEDGSMDVVL